MDRWVTLFAAIGEVEANLVAGFLAGEGIEVQFRTHVPPSVYPVTADGLAEVQVLVPEAQLEQARAALEAYRQAPDDRADEGS